jgi:hypothetical protein
MVVLRQLSAVVQRMVHTPAAQPSVHANGQVPVPGGVGSEPHPPPPLVATVVVLALLAALLAAPPDPAVPSNLSKSRVHATTSVQSGSQGSARIGPHHTPDGSTASGTCGKMCPCPRAA